MEMVEAAGVGLYRSVENREVIEKSVTLETLNTAKLPNHCTCIAHIIVTF